MEKNKPLILVIDDEPKYIRNIKAILEASGYRVHTASNGMDGVNAAINMEPNLILMDVRMPGMDGLEACKRMRGFTLIPILMLTALAEKEDIVHGLEVGADDYITKPFSSSELIARVKAALRRADYSEAPKGEASFRSGDLLVDYASQRVFVAEQEVHLTAIEYRLLCELTRAAGKVVTPEIILEKVWGPGYSGGNQLVPRVIHRLRQKIEPNPEEPNFIHTRFGLGYIFEPQK